MPDRTDRPAPLPLEAALLAAFRSLLRLYPAPFRTEFEAEIGAVFSDALAARRPAGAGAQFSLFAHELAELPGALAREYSQSTQERQALMRSFSARSGANPSRPHSWSEVFLAVLPYLLIMLTDLAHLPEALGWMTAEDASWLSVLATIAILLAAAACAVGLFLSCRRKTYPVWAASWYAVFGLAVLLLLVSIGGALLESIGIYLERIQGGIMYLVIPFFIAALLYALTRFEPLQGLLAVVPVTAMLWNFNMEFVPDPIEFALRGTALAIICLAIALVLRRGSWRFGLPVFLAANLAVGFIYSYAGIYHGGTLPDTAPGPSSLEVARSLIPQYLATGALFLGPLFARRFRLLGRTPAVFAPAARPSGDLAARRSAIMAHASDVLAHASDVLAHAYALLAQASLLLITLTYLAALMMSMDPPEAMRSFFGQPVLTVLLFLFTAGYLIGVVGLGATGVGAQRTQRAAIQAGPRQAASPAPLLDTALLAMLALGLPFALISPINVTWKWPISTLAGIPLMWATPDWLVFTIGLAWLAFSTWFVLREPGPAAPPTALNADPVDPAPVEV